MYFTLEILLFCVLVLSLPTKVVSQYSGQLAPISVDAVMKVIDPSSATNVDLRDVRVIKKHGLVVLHILGFTSSYVGG